MTISPQPSHLATRISKDAQRVATLLGAQVRLHRKQRGWTEMEAAERAGMSRSTLKAIERGALGVAVGLVLEACSVMGVPLFGSNGVGQTAALLDRTQLELATLPRRVRASKANVFDDNF